ncbi:regulator of G-protein signaling 16-like [Polypterus senegalus]|uniref:regulator of G-protein signaling 16-like n=1 Tax=Polypterus senegalus TaxID=55291 RepID=UPI001964582D|nr:regulator of G-protein signaling 16-like [Polypterus senegalus]
MCRGLDALPAACLERAKELKTRLSILLQKSDAFGSPTQSSKSEKSRPTPEEAMKWREAFDKLLASKHGVAAFRLFLRSEFSEENLDFWLACEEYKNIKPSSKLASRAMKIFEDFIDNEAPKEVNIDHETRAITRANLQVPSHSCFDLAQTKIYTLMEKDSYPRFLRSPAYQELVKKTAHGTIQLQTSCKKSHT